MKKILQTYKPFLLFLFKFFATYLVLTILYENYLNQFDSSKNITDDFTNFVANQTKYVLQLFDANSYTAQSNVEPSVKMYYKNTWVARIIEGCNALSVMIMFVSFIVAFSGKFIKTLLFIFSGLLIIHVFNIVRIALLSMAVYYFPEHQEFLHAVIFPLIIYGIVFLLWIIWVNKYSNISKYNVSK